MTTPIPITARPKQVNLTAVPKGVSSTGLWAFENWVTNTSVQIVTDTGVKLVFLTYDSSTLPIELTAVPKDLSLTAREKDD